MDWATVARAAARASKCRKRKVGAVIIRPSTLPDAPDILLAIGTSGPPRGAYCRWRTWSEGKDQDCIHAEWDAIVNAKGDLYGSTIYLTRQPCEGMCAEKIRRFNMTVVLVDDNE